MKYLKSASLAIILSFLLLSCEKEQDDTLIDDNNPFKDQVTYNGLDINNKKYETPFAFVETWGKNDSLSSDYDGYLTDGKYDKLLNAPKIID